MASFRASRSAALLLVAVAGCEGRARPWGGDREAGSAWQAPPSLPSAAGLVPIADAGADAEAADEPFGTGADGRPLPVRVGGPWVRCYGHFQPSDDPVKDVTRLSLLCGPATGMERVGKTPFEADVAEGDAPATFAVRAALGECFRVFAVGGPGVRDLDVVVRSSRGAPVAADHGDDRWPVVQPDRPFCMLEDDTLSIEIGARAGRGHAAAEVWRLSAANRGGDARPK